MKKLISVTNGGAGTFFGYDHCGTIVVTHCVDRNGDLSIVDGGLYDAPLAVAAQAVMKLPLKITITKDRTQANVRGMGVWETLTLDKGLEKRMQVLLQPWMESQVNMQGFDKMTEAEQATSVKTQLSDVLQMTAAYRQKMDSLAG